MLSNLSNVIVGGLLLGGIYALFTVGLTLIFGVMDIPNFAHGEFLMLGMYITFFIWKYFKIDPLLSTPIVALLSFILGYIVQQSLLERVIDRPGTAKLVIMLGISIILMNLGTILFKPITRVINTSYKFNYFSFYNVNIPVTRLGAFVVSVVSIVMLILFLNRTKTGLAIKASTQNLEAAQLVGVNIRLIYRICFGIGIGLSGICSPFLAIIFPLTPEVGQGYTLLAFVIAVLGGLGNIRGALIAALFIGLLTSFVSTYADVVLASPTYFLIFLIVIVFRAIKMKSKEY